MIQGGHHGFLQRKIEMLTPSALSPSPQRKKDSDGSKERSNLIGLFSERFERRGRGRTCDEHLSSVCRSNQVARFVPTSRPRLSKTGHGNLDQVCVCLFQDVKIQAEIFQISGREGFNDNIRFRQQFWKDLPPFLVFEVESDPHFVRIVTIKKETFLGMGSLIEKRSDLARRVPPRSLHFDDPGSHIRKKLGAETPLLVREIENPKVFQKSFSIFFPFQRSLQNSHGSPLTLTLSHPWERE